MKPYIMALDQGTTSSRCIIFDQQGKICSLAQQEFEQIYPQTGWVEHDPHVIWDTQLAVAKKAMAQINATAQDIAGIGITNQRETTIVWDKSTGEPVYNAIVWQCRRTANIIEDIKELGLSEYIQETTGLIPDAYFSGTKIKWILDHVKGAREKANKGQLLFGTVDSWLVWKLTNHSVHATDHTNASRTMLYDIHQLKWDRRICELLQIPMEMLPEVHPSSHLYGYTDTSIFGTPIAIAGIAGDQQAALFGQCCFEAGEVKNTYGTGCFLLMNTGNKAIKSQNGLITTLAASTDTQVQYALEGSIFVAGAAVQWLRDEVKLVNTAAQTEELATSVPDCKGVYLVPAFTGLGAPYWNPYTRGMIVGISRGTTNAHLIRATLESMAYQTYDVVQAMQNDSGLLLRGVKADGGACANNFLMQFQADILNSRVLRPTCIESTALGAAFLAGLAVGYFNDKNALKNIWQQDQCFTAHMPLEQRQQLLQGWKNAINSCIYWGQSQKKEQNR